VRVRGDSVTFRLVDADVRAVIRAVAPYLRKPVFAAELAAVRLTLDTPTPVLADNIPALFRSLLDAAGLTLKEDSVSYQVGSAAAAATMSPAQTSGDRSLHVLPLRHARASEVASTINALYGADVGTVPSRRLSSGTLGDELQRTRMPQQGERPAPDANTGFAASGPLTLVPDERTNSLLVRASDQDLQLIRQAVTQLDTRPLQVLIEVLIVEARKDRTFDLATAGSVSREKTGRSESAELSSANPGSLVLQFMKLSRADVSLRVSAAASRGDARIVSRPVLVVSNNAEARFLVGSQRPFVQVSRSLPTDAAVRDQVVQYRDVGTKLVVRPSINTDGYVALLVQQEMSTATDETQFGAPVISTREAMTEVLVRDGQTIVIGGLTDSNRSAGQSGIPLLSAIPLVGGLFGEARRRDAATEIFLFLTPHVIRTDEDADSLTVPRLPSTEKGKNP
jgi:general secretion pathway protein D